MKLERLHEYVLPVCATLAGMFIAFYCGRLTGAGQMGTVALIAAFGVSASLVFMFRNEIWLVLVILWPLAGRLPMLPLPFSVRDLVVMVVFCAFLGLIAVKEIRAKPKYDATDICLGIIIVYIATVFIRNPVGFNALGAARVGGRPYFDLGIACMAYWVLSRSELKKWACNILPFSILATKGLELTLHTIATFVPRSAAILGQVYSGFDPSNFEEASVWSGPQQEATTRKPFLSSFSNTLLLIGFSYWRPLTMATPVFWVRFSVLSVGLAGVMISGFRSIFVGVIGMAAISSILRGRKSDVALLAAIALPVLAVVVAMHGTIFTFPSSIQRTLSFLPGKWDPIAAREAKSSTEWRLQMWRLMLTEDKYITDKWLGDGFGFSQRQLDAMANNARMGNFGDQEHYLIVGNVHSGPISAIRYVGVVGCVLFVIFLVLIARKSWIIARKATGTHFYPVVLFVAIPAIWEPLNYVFIFGSFDVSFPAAVYTLGLVKMLERSLDAETTIPSKSESPRLYRSMSERKASGHRCPDVPVAVGDRV